MIARVPSISTTNSSDNDYYNPNNSSMTSYSNDSSPDSNPRPSANSTELISSFNNHATMFRKSLMLTSSPVANEFSERKTDFMKNSPSIQALEELLNGPKEKKPQEVPIKEDDEENDVSSVVSKKVSSANTSLLASAPAILPPPPKFVSMIPPSSPRSLHSRSNSTFNSPSISTSDKKVPQKLTRVVSSPQLGTSQTAKFGSSLNVRNVNRKPETTATTLKPSNSKFSLKSIFGGAKKTKKSSSSNDLLQLKNDKENVTEIDHSTTRKINKNFSSIPNLNEFNQKPMKKTNSLFSFRKKKMEPTKETSPKKSNESTEEFDEPVNYNRNSNQVVEMEMTPIIEQPQPLPEVSISSPDLQPAIESPELKGLQKPSLQAPSTADTTPSLQVNDLEYQFNDQLSFGSPFEIPVPSPRGAVAMVNTNSDTLKNLELLDDFRDFEGFGDGFADGFGDGFDSDSDNDDNSIQQEIFTKKEQPQQQEEPLFEEKTLFPKSLNKQEVDSIVSIERSRSQKSIKKSSSISKSINRPNKDGMVVIPSTPDLSHSPLPSNEIDNLNRSPSILKNSKRSSVYTEQSKIDAEISDLIEFSDFIDFDIDFNMDHDIDNKLDMIGVMDSPVVIGEADQFAFGVASENGSKLELDSSLELPTKPLVELPSPLIVSSEQKSLQPTIESSQPADSKSPNLIDLASPNLIDLASPLVGSGAINNQNLSDADNESSSSSGLTSPKLNAYIPPMEAKTGARPISMSFRGLSAPKFAAKSNANDLRSVSSSQSLNSSMSSSRDASFTKKYEVRFSSRIILYDTYDEDEYDRHPDTATCNQLTPYLAQQIKDELNQFKAEMIIHESSKCYTHFF